MSDCRKDVLALVVAMLLASLVLVAAPTLVASQTVTGDASVASMTRLALFANKRVKSAHISIEALNGVVTLRGTVDSDEAKAAAATLAGEIEGVTRVRNDLQVVSPDSRQAVQLSDDDITRRVESRLTQDGRLTSVDVRTDAGVVTLTGEVSTVGAGLKAFAIAGEASGVRSVTNELIYEPTMSRHGETDNAKR
jgi:osmotically-inducible protein OsmY